TRGEPLEQPDVPPRIPALGRAEELEELVRGPYARAHQLLRPAKVSQVAHPDAPASELVLIGGPDAAAGRADLLPGFTGPVEPLVERERQVRAFRNVELMLGADTPLDLGIELGEERRRIELDPVADQAD